MIIDRLVPGVRRIAVLRANAVGDFLFALPALHALRAAYPQAELFLLGKAWHAEFLRGRPGPFDRIEVLPAIRGVTAGADEAGDEEDTDRFLARMRALEFDIAFQIFGGGRYSNPFLRRLGARVTVGFRTPDAEPLDRCLPFVYLQNERLRLLEAVGLAGARPVEMDPRLALTDSDRDEAAHCLPEHERPLVVLQPGASDPRRRWSPKHFAVVGDALHRRGLVIAINGTVEERPIVAAVRKCMRAPSTDLSGKLSLSGLAGLLARARLLISNDTGPLHLAQAVGTRTVGVYWLTNLFVSGPLVQSNHRHAVSPRTRCPVCGLENIRQRCPHDPSFVDDVMPDEVLARAEELLAQED